MLKHFKEKLRQNKDYQQKIACTPNNLQDQDSMNSSINPISTLEAPNIIMDSNSTFVVIDKLKNTQEVYPSDENKNNAIKNGDKQNQNTSTKELAKKALEQDKKIRSQLPFYRELEQFEVIKKIGDGAFSNVYEALDYKSRKKVAIKVARKSLSDNPNKRHLHSSFQKNLRVTERANIMKEVQIMSNISHPNIIQLISFTESPENYFLTLELCGGGELFHQIVKLTYFSEELSRHVISQVAQAVKYLHNECGIVHRDIKPENILFESIPIIPSKHSVIRPTDTEEKEDEGEFTKYVGGGGIGKVKLADFGLSKVIWNDATFTPCGTAGYTAPEIVCDKHYSKSVDMWALGCVLYTILCGFPPFYDEKFSGLTKKVSRGEYSFLSPWWNPISDSVKDLISHLLLVDSRRRYTIDQFLNHPWVTDKPFISDKNTSTTALVQEQKYERMLEQMALEVTIQQAMQSDLSTPPSKDEHMGYYDDSLIFSNTGEAALKDIFDVTYTVQRMEEESASYREKYYQEPYLSNQKYGTHLAQEKQSLTPTYNSHDIAAGKNYYSSLISQQNPTIEKRRVGGFHLNISNATILNKRKLNIQ